MYLKFALIVFALVTGGGQGHAQSVQSLVPSAMSDGNDYFESASITRDGKFSLGVSRRQINVWNNESKKEIHFASLAKLNDPTAAIASKSNDCLLAVLDQSRLTGKQSVIKIRRLSDMKILQQIKLKTDAYFVELKFNDSAEQILIAEKNRDRSLIRVFDVDSGAEVNQINPFDQDFEVVAFVPNTSSLVMGGLDASGITLKIWDYKTNKIVASSRWQKKRVVAVAASNDGQLVASVEEDGMAVKLFDVSNGKFRNLASFACEYRADRRDTSLSFCDDDSRLWYRDRSQIQAWDLDTREQIIDENFSLHDYDVPSSDAQILLCAGKKPRQLQLLQTKELVAEAATPIWRHKINPRSNSIRRICVGRNGTLVFRGDSSRSLLFYDAATGQQLSTIDSINGSPFFNQNSIFTKTRDRQLTLLDLETRQNPAIAVIDPKDRLEHAFETLSGMLVIATQTGPKHVLKIFGKNRKLAASKVFDNSVDFRQLVVGRDGKMAAVGNCHVWDLENDVELASFNGSALGFSPDGAELLCDGGKSIFDLESGLLEYPWPHFRSKYSQIAKHQRIVVTLFDKQIRIWDYGTKRLVATLNTGIPDQPSSFAISPDAKRAYCGYKNGEVAAWDLSPWLPKNDVASEKNQAELWPAIPRSFTSNDGVEIVISTENAVEFSKVEQALRNALKTVRQEGEGTSRSQEQGTEQ